MRTDFETLDARIGTMVLDLPAAAEREFAHARAEPTHGYDYVVTSDATERSVLELLDVDPGEEVRFVGHGWNEPRARRYWRGEVPENELPSVLAAAQAAVDASPDGSPMSPMVYRALAAGTLVVTRNRTGAAERFGGALPTFVDRHDLRHALDGVLGDPDGSSVAATRLQAQVLEEDLVSHRADSLLSVAHHVAAAPRIAWRTGPPRPDDVERWGDTHLARHLAAALRRRGFVSKVTPLRLWDQPAHQDVDIVIHLHGLTPYVPKPAHFNVLWIISHPELVSPRMCDRFDLVLVASQVFADRLRTDVSVPVVTWLQATNTRLFQPRAEERTIDLLFVGNSRRQDRPIVRWAVEAGLPLTVYGGDWEAIVPRELVAAEFVPNHELPELYSQAKVILNDHWPEMAEHGFVSNRIFDALACGTPVISDAVVGIERVVPRGVLTVDGPEALARACAELTGDPCSVAEAGEAGRSAVVNQHSADRRADELVTILESLRADHPRLSGILDRTRVAL
jgi:glycosyltransferase involved in cell wall biosynthesis